MKFRFVVLFLVLFIASSALAAGKKPWMLDIEEAMNSLKSSYVDGKTTKVPGADGNCAQFDSSGNLADSGAGCGAGTGDSVKVDGVATVDPDFTNDGDLDPVDCTGAGAPDASCVADGDVIYRLKADAVSTLTDIAAALKSGADATLVTGTAGADTECAQWNADGDLITSGAGCGGADTSANTECAGTTTYLDGEGTCDDLSSVYQPLDSTLTSVAALGTAADKVAYTTGVDTWAESALTAFGRSILDDADEATFKATVNLEAGTDVQAQNATLQTIADASDVPGLNVDITNTTLETTIATDDRILIYDITAAANRAMTKGNFVAGIGAGQAVVFDIGDDGGDDSTDIGEIATTGDTNTIFTEVSADKVLIAVGNNWPTADTANAGDSATAFFSAGTIEHEYGGLEADVNAYTGLVGISAGATSEVDTESELEAIIGDMANIIQATEIDTESELETIVGDMANIIQATEIDTESELETLVGDMANIIQATEIDTFAELDTLVADKGLVNLADAQTVTGVLRIADDTEFAIGTTDADDWAMSYTEAGNDNLLFATAETTNAGGTDIALFRIQADSAAAGMTADQEVFEILRGTNELFAVDEDGDVTFAGSLTAPASADPGVVLNEITASDTDFWFGINADQAGDDDDFFEIGKGLVIGTTSRWQMDGSGNVINQGNQTADSFILEGGTYDTTLTPGTPTENVSYQLPLADGTSGQVLSTNASGVMSWTSVTATPAGADTNVQYNSSGSLGAEAAFSYNATNNTLSITQAASNPVFQVGDGTYVWEWTPQVGIEGVLEVNGFLRADGSIAIPAGQSLYSGADTAEAGSMRFSNGDSLQWEASPAGTDVKALHVDSSEVVWLGTSGAALVKANTDFHSTGDITIIGSDLSIGAAGVKFTGDGDGAVTLLGLGDGADEDLTLNLDDTADTVVLSSSTAVSKIDFSAMDLATTGDIELGHATDTTIARSGAGAITVEGAVVSLLGATIGASEVDADIATQAELDAGVGITTVTDADGFTMSAAQCLAGVVAYATGAGTITLCPVLSTSSFTVIDYGGAAVVLNPDASGTEDTIILDGTALAQGDGVTSTSTTGDMIVCTYQAANTWYCASGSPDGDHWTDTN